MYDGEFYPKRNLTPRTPPTRPMILIPPLRSSTQGKGIKLLSSKLMLQRLPMLLAKVKPENTSENHMNEIKQIPFSLYQAKQFSKKVYKNLLKKQG